MQQAYYPSEAEFIHLSKGANVIPVYREVSADLDTPVSAFLKVASESEYSFLLESVEGQEKVARYSFLGSHPSMVLVSKGTTIEIRSPHTGACKRFITATDPLGELKTLMEHFRPVRLKGLPRFYGGFVGFFGYDIVRFFEDLPDTNRDDVGVMDAAFMLTDTMLIFDHVNHSVKFLTNVILTDKGRRSNAAAVRHYRRAVLKVKTLERHFSRAYAERHSSGGVGARPAVFRSSCTQAAFQRMVRRAKAYIRRGDIIQVVLSQRFRAPLTQEPFRLYRTLRRLNPSPYMFFLRFKDMCLIGASPEMLVRSEDGLVQTRPIAGTRPRGRNEAEDARLERQLLTSIKEKAEHVMLVDLGRNDLGRVCVPGTVRLSEFMNVERYSHVMHLVTEVRGRLLPGYDCFDVLRACFPAGTVSGSPKIRAMEIIDELEGLRRGTYAGCVGYFSFSRNMDTCITIRTILVKGKEAFVQAGAGIVADSIPRREYHESVNKAKALIEALGQ